MKKSLYFAFVCALFAVAMPDLKAQSTTGSGSMGVSGTIVPSISLTFSADNAGIALTGGGSSAASLAFSNIQAFGGSVPTGVTKTLQGTAPAYTGFTVATPFDVYVNVANLTSASYALTAELANADAQNTWTIDSTPVTSTSAASVESTATYGTASHTLYVAIPFSGTTLSVANTINFVATAN